MGAIRELATEQDARHAVAVKIGLEVGLLERCDIHGCVFDAMNDFALEDAFRFADSLIDTNDPSVAIFAGSRKKLHHAVEECRSGMSNCCDDCYEAKQKK